jgi:hypothetical protein
MPAFARYVGIDYSGAETPTASLKGLRIFAADRASPPVEVMPPPSARKYWTRRSIAEWLVERLGEDAPTLVGIDHGFSFPIRYFQTHGLKPDWPNFLDHHSQSLCAEVAAAQLGLDFVDPVSRAAEPIWRATAFRHDALVAERAVVLIS